MPGAERVSGTTPLSPRAWMGNSAAPSPAAIVRVIRASEPSSKRAGSGDVVVTVVAALNLTCRGSRAKAVTVVSLGSTRLDGSKPGAVTANRARGADGGGATNPAGGTTEISVSPAPDGRNSPAPRAKPCTPGSMRLVATAAPTPGRELTSCSSIGAAPIRRNPVESSNPFITIDSGTRGEAVVVAKTPSGLSVPASSAPSGSTLR